MKTFNLMCNVGSSKYVVSYHDGVSTHKDGSPFFDIRIFKGRRSLTAFLDKLKVKGYNADALNLSLD